LATVVVCAIFADVISPVDPAQQHLLYRLSPPGTVSEDGVTFVLGTDGLGRDVLSGIIHGSRVSLIVAVTAVGLGMLIGVALGLVSGYSGGWLDTVIMRAVDVTIVLPFMLMALVLRLALGPGLGSIVIALGISGWATHDRLVRGEVLSLRNKEYVLASVANGAPHGFILLRRILPHILSSAILLAILLVTIHILAGD